MAIGNWEDEARGNHGKLCMYDTAHAEPVRLTVYSPADLARSICIGLVAWDC